MTRWALGLEYDGARFCGWQSQSGVLTVQDTLEAALARVADAPVRVVAAGRTDTGVHALCQVVHFDSDRLRPPEAFVRGTNSHLGHDVAVLWARVVSEAFHARFAATGRSYRYVILNRSVRPGLWSGRVSFDYRALQIERMQEAAHALIGRHDFSAYRASQCQAKTPVRTIRHLTVSRHGPFVVIRVEADAFLHHMVRNIAGVLCAIGAGERPVSWAAEVLAERARTRGGVTAPPAGLYFEGPSYPERFGLPRPAADAWPWAMGSPSP